MSKSTVFFMHLPKTGGMTVEKFLADRITAVGPWYYDDHFFTRDARISDYRLIRGHLPYYVSEMIPGDVFRITWLRDPVARTLSAYKHFLRDRHHPLHEEVVRNASTLVEGFEIPEVRITLTNPVTRFLGADLDFASLVEDVRRGKRAPKEAADIAAKTRRREATEETFERACERLATFDFVGFTDRMEPGLKSLAGRLGVEPPDGAEHLNAAWSHQVLSPGNLSSEGLDVVRAATELDRRLFRWAADREGLAASDGTISSSEPSVVHISERGGVDETRKRDPILCTGLYRSGTSLLWNLLRHHKSVCAYYEPTHTNLRDRLGAGGGMKDPSHQGLENYYAEYGTVPRETMETHERAFGVSRFHMAGADEYKELEKYLKGLVDAAGSKRAVMKLMRNDFRMPWLRARFPSASIVHLNRNPRSVWASVANTMSDKDWVDPWINSGFDIIVWAAGMGGVFPELFDGAIDTHYARHYLLWRLADEVACHYADIVIDYESDLLKNPRKTMENILHSTSLSRDGWDARALDLVKSGKDDGWKRYKDIVDFDKIEKKCDRLFEKSGIARAIEESHLDAQWPQRSDQLGDPRVVRTFRALSEEVSRVRGQLVLPEATIREKDVYIESLRENYANLLKVNETLNESLAESGRYAESLEKALEESGQYADSLERERAESKNYTESLQKKLGEAREYSESLEKERAKSEEYAKSLERERAESKRYAESLEKELRKSREYSESLGQERAESEKYAKSLERDRVEAKNYAKSLEKELGESREYSESLEKERAESEEYAKSLEEALRDSREYADSLLEERTNSREYVKSLEEALRDKEKELTKLNDLLADKSSHLAEQEERIRDIQDEKEKLESVFAYVEEALEIGEEQYRLTTSQKEKVIKVNQQYIDILKETLERKEQHLSDLEEKLSSLTERVPLLRRFNRFYLRHARKGK